MNSQNNNHNKIATSKGLLEIPYGVEPEVLTPAVEYKLKKETTHLFITLPKSEKKRFSKTTILSSMKDTVKDLECESVSEINDDGLEEIKDYYKLPENHRILAAPFHYPDPNTGKMVEHPFLLRAIAVKNKAKQDVRTDMPESGHEVEVVAHGYVYKDDVIPSEKFVPFQKDIFQSFPSIYHLFQLYWANCFLLASINSILALDIQPNEVNTPGMDFIMNMMKQMDDGTVVVRLFNPNTFEPIYIKVKNAYLLDKGGYPLSADKLPWATILVYAYAALAFKLDDKNKTTYKIEPSSFLTIFAGGRSINALRILVGKKAEAKKINFVSKNISDLTSIHTDINNLFLKAGLHAADSTYQAVENEVQAGSDYQTIYNLLSPRLPNNWLDKTLFKNELLKSELYNALDKDIDLLRDLGIYAYIVKTFYNTELPVINSKYVDREALLKYIDALKNVTPPVPPIILEKFTKYTEKKQIQNDGKVYYNIPGKLFSGEYTEDQYKLYHTLQKAIAGKKLLTAATYTKFEENVSGLRAKHAYTISGVREVININNDGTETTLLKVRLRNPWGMVGRDYVQNNGDYIGIEAKEKGEFELDIIDFEKYFFEYTVGELPPQIELIKQQRNINNARLVADSKKNHIALFNKVNDSQKDIYVNELAKLESSDLLIFLNKQTPDDLYELRKYIKYLIQIDETKITTQSFETSIRIRNYKLLYEKIHQHIIKLIIDSSKSLDKNKILTESKLIQNSHERFLQNSKHILKTPYKFINNSQDNKTTNKHLKNLNQAFIEELLNQPNRILNTALKQQSLNDLYRLAQELKLSIKTRQKERSHQNSKLLLQTYAKRIKKETELLNKIQGVFSQRLQHSLQYESIEKKANAYLKSKSALARIFHSLKTTFRANTNDDARKTYKRYLKMTSPLNANKPINQNEKTLVQYVQDYFDDKNVFRPEAFFHLSKYIHKNSNEIASFNLIDRLDGTAKLNINMRNGQTEAITMSAIKIAEFAEIQRQFESSYNTIIEEMGNKIIDKAKTYFRSHPVKDLFQIFGTQIPAGSTITLNKVDEHNFQLSVQLADRVLIKNLTKTQVTHYALKQHFAERSRIDTTQATIQLIKSIGGNINQLATQAKQQALNKSNVHIIKNKKTNDYTLSYKKGFMSTHKESISEREFLQLAITQHNKNVNDKIRNLDPMMLVSLASSYLNKRKKMHGDLINTGTEQNPIYTLQVANRNESINSSNLTSVTFTFDEIKAYAAEEIKFNPHVSAARQLQAPNA